MAIAKQTEISIPRSVAGDKGQYFLLEKKNLGHGVIRALHKRVGVDTISYSLTETNCKTMQMRELGISEESASRAKSDKNPTKWFDLVSGSSKSDLANFICK